MKKNSTKERILEAAELLIKEHGPINTTISQIAKEAKVADSLAYQYFKGKEDILFSIVNERLKEAVMLRDDYLQGIIDAKSKLSKFLWHGLKYNDRNQAFVQNVFFHCRSRSDFYFSEAYTSIREHAKKVLDILEQGANDGVFRNDINMRLVREIIYGTIEFEAMSCSLAKEIKESSADLDDITTLIFRMIEKKEGSDIATDKKLNILNAAEKLFSEYGYTKTKISDIAKVANVSEGTIYDYFKNKDDLILSISETRLNEHIKKLAGVFHIESPVKKLRRFIKYHFSLFMRNRDFLKVFVMDTILNDKFYSSKAYETYKDYLGILEEIIDDGKEDGIFYPNINVRVFRNMFMGSFTHMSLRWVVFEDQKFDTIMEIEQLVDLLTRAVTSCK